MRLTDADVLMDAVEEIDWYHLNNRGEMVHGANSDDHQPWFKSDDVFEVIRNAPTVDAQVWTLCKERLPEANGRYLVTRGLNACGALWNRTYILHCSDLMGLKSEKIWWSGRVGKNDFEKYTDVIAWMPLPKPYREG